jgi:hypothetical protein
VADSKPTDKDVEIMRYALGLPDTFFGRRKARKAAQKHHDIMLGGPRIRFPGSEWLAGKMLDVIDGPVKKTK